MDAAPRPQEKAMYVASDLDRDWLLTEQRKLHARSRDIHDYVFRKLWGLLTDPHNLRLALARVARNKGARTSGVDRVTVRSVLASGADTFIGMVREDLRSGTYRPSPVRRVLIPKAGQPGKFRPLGIPTVKDRVVQAAVKNILEPIFEADFYPSSHGFRPGKCAHGALEQLRKLLRPRAVGPEAKRRLPYQWAIEGDIKGCFDNIDHHGLMRRLRRRIGDPKVNRLVLAFLKAGILSERQFLRSEAGTPQGGILSPLLANIALSVIDERYERWAWPRRLPTPRTDPKEIQERASYMRCADRRRNKVVFFPIRYADDFIILVNVPPGPDQEERAREAALREKSEVTRLLRDQLNLELSESKTLVTSVTTPMRFLGHSVFVRPHPRHGRMVSRTVIPKEKSHSLRERIKRLFRRSTGPVSLANRLIHLNWLLRGWSNFYRHATGAKRVFGRADFYVWWTIFRWLKKKHKRAGVKRIVRQYAGRKPGQRSLRWRDGNIVPFEMSRVRVGPFYEADLRTPDFATTSTASPVHSERCTPGSERGTRKPARR